MGARIKQIVCDGVYKQIQWYLIIKEKREVPQNTSKVTGSDAMHLTAKRQHV